MHLLIVSYHYGSDGATGGFRWHQMALDLASFGWTIDVLCAGDPGSITYQEHPQIHVEAVKPPSWAIAYHDGVRSTMTSLSRWRRARFVAKQSESNISAGEAPAPVVWQEGEARRGLSRISASVTDSGHLVEEVAWASHAYATAKRLVQRRRPRAVLVSTPPHPTQMLGVRLSRAFGIPLVADFRDPWIAGHGSLIAYPTDVARILGEYHEPRVMSQAELVLFNTDPMALETTRVLGTRAPRKWVVIPNGSDSWEQPALPDREKFIVAMTGHLHPYMDPRPLFAACARLRRREPERTRTLQVHFQGTGPEFGGVQVTRLAADCGLSDCFVLSERGTRREARSMQEAAAVLVLFDTPSGIMIPMKFYDYVQVNARILAFGAPHGALAGAAARVGIPMIAPNDESRIDEYLHDALARWESGSLSTPADVDGVFSRIHQSRRVHDLLVSISSAPSREKAVVK